MRPSLIENPTTSEETEINERIEAHIKAIDNRKFVLTNTWIAYAIGLVAWIFGTGAIEAAGTVLILIALILFVISFFLGGVESQKYKAAQELILPWLRNRAKPFYEDVKEAFADRDDVHIVLRDDGGISIVQVKKGGKEMK